MRNIVVLDGHTLNPGDLDWSGLEALGRLTVHDRTAPQEAADRARDAEIVLTNKTPLSAETIARLPKLRYIGVLATGYNVVDTKAAAARGIPVTNVPDYGTMSVAQFAFALLLALCHRVQRHADDVRQGGWSRCPDFSYVLSPQVELAGKTLGIVGFGTIGRQTARIGEAFGMRILALSRTPKPAPEFANLAWAKDLQELLAASDVVSLHCPLTPETERMIRRETLVRMKPSAFLINTSRGPLLDEQDVADALNEGRLAGAAVDVLSTEPPAEGSNPLLAARNCLITPHMAWASKEARERLMAAAVDNVRAFLAGSPKNVVNG